jgi:hypothetical protein
MTRRTAATAAQRLADWLEISTEGFAQRQADRKPAHLLKEIVQNALDATENVPDGAVRVAFAPIWLPRRTPALRVSVSDNVPMNPRRDAVASGYLRRLYGHVLPHLLPRLTPEQLRDEWVSQSLDTVEAPVEQDIVSRAFGDNAVRSVPVAGKHDFGSDARELGYTPVDTPLLPSGLRASTRQFLTTSRAVELEHRQAVAVAAEQAITPTTPHDDLLITWYRWVASEVTGIPVIVTITPEIQTPSGAACLAWRSEGELLLSAQHRVEWDRPFEPIALGHLAHETAHHLAEHHGDGFRKAVQLMGGRIARLCLDRSAEILSRFGGLR